MWAIARRFFGLAFRPVVAALCVALFSVSVAAQGAGTFDATFGINGRVINLTPGLVPGNSYANAMAVQADGKILLAGHCADGISAPRTACVARLLPNGQIDTSFTGPSGSAAGKFLYSFGETTGSVAEAVAVAPDGKILVLARCFGSVQTKLCALRMNENGSLDNSFNGGFPSPGGELQFALPTGSAAAQAMAIQPDGKTIFLYDCADVDKFCLQRINLDGSLDTGFDGPNANGTGVGSGNGRFVLDLFGLGGEFSGALALSADGKILATGRCLGPNGVGMCVVRLNANGSYDTSFDGPSGGGNGRAVFGINGVDQAVGQSIAVQPDGKILVAGFCGNSSDSYRFCGARLTPSGAFDPEFLGPTGSTPGRFRFAVQGPGTEYLRQIAIQADGRILVSGFCDNGMPSTNGFDFCIARFNSDGSFDSSFDGPGGSANGRFRVGVANDMDTFHALKVLPNGKILAGGTCSDTCGGSCGGNGFCVARFNGGSQGYETCSLDVDGDGVVGANDALIHARVALGFKGTALTDGLSFSQGAVRTSATDIRKHLIADCGMVSP
jgi:uncharacterized delta-60 repeat protein